MERLFFISSDTHKKMWRHDKDIDNWNPDIFLTFLVKVKYNYFVQKQKIQKPENVSSNFFH